MKKILRRTVSVCLILLLVLASLCVSGASAATQSQLRSKISNLENESRKIEAEIKQLKNKGAEQQQIADAYQKKINNLQAQINLCNSEISSINKKIAENKAAIKKKQQEIDDQTYAFQKRLRAICMNSSYNSALVLLGATDYSNYLELEELTSTVAAQDRQMVNEMVADIKALQKTQKENDALLAEQVDIKNEMLSKQQSLRADQQKVQQIVNSCNKEAGNLANENADIEAQIKKARRELEEAIRRDTPTVNRKMNASGFIWPVPGYYGITQHFGGGHTGMDIASGGIGGAPIVAIADGVVNTRYYKSGWSASRDGKSGLNSYGNYVVVDHGTYKDGNVYSSWYAHMASVAVRPGQEVKQGQVLGYVGNTGNVYGRTGIHLHLSIKRNNSWVNPYSYVG